MYVNLSGFEHYLFKIPSPPCIPNKFSYNPPLPFFNLLFYYLSNIPDFFFILVISVTMVPFFYNLYPQ